jgi:hypothetical protein
MTETIDPARRRAEALQDTHALLRRATAAAAAAMHGEPAPARAEHLRYLAARIDDARRLTEQLQRVP